MNPLSPISPVIKEVLDLFHTELAPVSFAGMEAGVLTTAAAAVEEAAAALADAEAAAELARASLAARQDELAQKAQRALAYARIYAEEDEALRAKVEAIALPRTSRLAKEDESQALVAPLKRRGRPPKTDRNDTTGSLLAPRPRELDDLPLTSS